MAMALQWECQNCLIKQACYQWLLFQKEKGNAWTVRNVLAEHVDHWIEKVESDGQV
jgi:hypothetical protein